MQEASINGPFFVSIGDAEKLNTFLDQNPSVPRDQAFVDDYSFGAYETAGFDKKIGDDPEAAKEVKLSAPELSPGQWWGYITNVGSVSPIPKDMKFGDIPEGVLRLGGTYVIDGKNVKFAWSDRLPGDHPDIAKALATVEGPEATPSLLEQVTSSFESAAATFSAAFESIGK